ncbi:cystatin-C-like [Perognathus longimembris pacificus]|uniref:cystatin-C-like n=1 Tax=Perognathus longimembris pacificus TaxID=214514 RepID=UPI002019512F|nr:cystatin-C-like [Perognathus longimembris pacificus]
MSWSLRLPLLLLAAVAVALAVRPEAGLGASQPRMKLGGIEEADVNEQGVRKALSFALSEYNKASNDAFHSRVVQVVRARKQIVAGMKYYLDVEIGRTTCTKSQSNLTDCPFHEQPNLKRKELCSFQIYSVPWTGKVSMLKSSCENA